MLALLDDSGTRGGAERLLRGCDLGADQVAQVFSAGYEPQDTHDATANKYDDYDAGTGSSQGVERFQSVQRFTLSLRLW